MASKIFNHGTLLDTINYAELIKVQANSDSTKVKIKSSRSKFNRTDKNNQKSKPIKMLKK